MRLFAHNHLGPRVYASFENGLAYEYTAGKCLDYVLAVEKNVYPLVARKVGTLHRLMSGYVGETIKTNDFNLLNPLSYTLTRQTIICRLILNLNDLYVESCQ